MMAEHAPSTTPATAARPPQGAAARATPEGPSAGTIYWRYLIFWLLLFALVYFVSLYGIVAEA